MLSVIFEDSYLEENMVTILKRKHVIMKKSILKHMEDI